MTKERQPIFYTTHNLAVDAVYVVHPQVLEECMPERVGVPFLFYVGLGQDNPKALEPAHKISQQFMGFEGRCLFGEPRISREEFDRKAASLGIHSVEGEYYPLIYPFAGNKNDLNNLLRDYGLDEGEKWAQEPQEIRVGDKKYTSQEVANSFVPFSAGAGYESSCVRYFRSGGESIQSRQEFTRLKEYLAKHKEELTHPLTRKEKKEFVEPQVPQRRKGLWSRIFG